MNPELDLLILKVLISNKKYALEFAAENNEKIFNMDYWRFVKVVVDYIKYYKEIPTKRILIEKSKQEKKNDLAIYLEKTWDQIEKIEYDEKEFKFDLDKLKNRYSKKLIFNFKDQVETAGTDLDVNQSLKEITAISNNIKGLSGTRIYNQGSLKESIPEFRTRYVAKKQNPLFEQGIMTGYSFFDLATGGLRSTECLIVGSETGGGKTQMLINLARSIWMQNNTVDMESNFEKGYNVQIYSLEVPRLELIDRLLASISNVPQRSIRDAALTKEEEGRIAKSLKFINNYTYTLDIIDVPRGLSVKQLESIYNDAKSKYTTDVIIVDYLSLMHYDGDEEQDWLRLAYISEQFSELIRANNIVGISAFQLNDNSAKQQNPIGLSRIGRSKMIAHNFNFVWQIEKRKNEENYPDLMVHTIKSRRSELTVGSLSKNYANCLILDQNKKQNYINNSDISEKFIDI